MRVALVSPEAGLEVAQDPLVQSGGVPSGIFVSHWSEPKIQDQRASTSKLNDNGRQTRWAGRSQGWNAGVLGYTNLR